MILPIIEILLFLPLAFLLIISILSRRVRNSEPPIPFRPGTMICLLGKEYVWMVLYLLIWAFLAPLDRLARKKGIVKQGAGPLIIILHGYFSSPSHWLLLSHRLRKKGFQNVIRYSWRSICGSVELEGKELADRLAHLNNTPVILVGHSMGGIVAVLAASLMPSDTVKKIITLGTPFSGTRMATFAASRNARKLTPDSSEIAAVKKALTKVDGKVELICFWSRFDPLIVPSHSAAPDRGRAVEACGVGHTAYHFEVDITPFL